MIHATNERLPLYEQRPTREMALALIHARQLSRDDIARRVREYRRMMIDRRGFDRSIINTVCRYMITADCVPPRDRNGSHLRSTGIHLLRSAARATRTGSTLLPGPSLGALYLAAAIELDLRTGSEVRS